MNTVDSFTLRPDLDPPVTRESVITAFLSAKFEREQFELETGARLDERGHIVVRKEGA